MSPELPNLDSGLRCLLGQQAAVDLVVAVFEEDGFAAIAARWLSPDWAAAAEAVPYASYGSPQTLNLYAFVGNNPLSRVDPDGHTPLRMFNGITPGGTDFSMIGMFGGAVIGVGTASPDDGPNARKIAWATLSSAQQSLVSGGANGWNAMTADAQDNFDAITNALSGIKLSNGVTGLSEIKSANMRENGREMNVVWKPGAADAFKATGKFNGYYINPSHGLALVLHQSGVGVRGMELVFPTLFNQESQAHIDYRSLGDGHYIWYNDDVAYDGENEEEYRKWYGPLPGLIP